jgi:Tol biopolymer transport system component
MNVLSITKKSIICVLSLFPLLTSSCAEIQLPGISFPPHENIISSTSRLTDLRITSENLRILVNFSEDGYEPRTNPPEDYKKLLWPGYGESLKVENITYCHKLNGTNYTQLNHANSSPGQCVSAVLSLSWTKAVIVKDWIKGRSVMSLHDVKPGTIIATFFADNGTKYPYQDDGSPRHVAIFKEYAKDNSGFWVWDQNWYTEGVFGKHFISTSGNSINNAYQYNVVQINDTIITTEPIQIDKTMTITQPSQTPPTQVNTIDKQILSFSSAAPALFGTWFEVYVMNADGSNRKKLTGSPNGDATWSPDANRITFTSFQDGNNEIYIMNSNGSNQTNLTKNQAFDADSSWSPNSDRIVFNSDRDGRFHLYIMDTQGLIQTQLTNNAGNDVDPVWSPKGDRVVFSSDYEGNKEIYVINTDGTNQIRLTNSLGDDVHPNWSPDGLFIIFTSNRDGNNEIYTMKADGSPPTRLTNSDSDDDSPAWSPDGKRIAFHSNRTGTYQIYVMDLTQLNPICLAHDGYTEKYPSWAPFTIK